MRGSKILIRVRNDAEIGSIQHCQGQASSYQSFPGKQSNTANTISKNQNQTIYRSTSICMHAYVCTHTYTHSPFSPKLKWLTLSLWNFWNHILGDHHTQCPDPVSASPYWKWEALCKSARSRGILARASGPICLRLRPQRSRALINDLRFLPSSTLQHWGKQ